MKVIDYKKFDINNIIYQEPVKTAGGCLLSKTLYGYKSEEIPIYIQTPRLKNVSNLEISDSRTYIELELDKQHINFYEFINNVDDHNISKTHSRSEDWFQQKLPMDVIDDFYKANIKMRKYNKSPVIKFKIPLYKNKTKKGCDIFGDDLKPIDISEVKKDVEVICILELQGIKFFKQRFEAEWNVVQLRAYLKPNISRECLINEDFLSDNEDTNNDNDSDSDIVEEPKEQVKNIEIKVSQTNDTKINEIIKVSKNNEESELNSEPIKEEEEVVEVVEETTIDNKNIEIEIPEDNTEEESHNLEESENNNNSESESDSESDYNSDNDNSDNDTIQDYYSDNFSDEDEICEGLDKHLEEINFAEDEEEEQENGHNIEEPQSDSEIESEAEEELKEESKEEELAEENTIEPVNNSPENKTYMNQNIGDLISEIEKLKKIAFDKDEEVNQLKSKYKNLYSELNI